MRYTRRQAITGLGVASGTALSGRRAFAQMQAGTIARRLPGANICVLTPQAAEGPYYLDPKLERAAIAEDRVGVPLELLLQVVEATDCSALSGVRVDIWHTDATGHYSGFQGQGDQRDVSTTGKTFLRGTQFTDASGEVAFSTIYPGWYAGRTPHIHFKAFVDRRDVVTGQIYFPDALSEFIYTNVPPYSARRRRDTTNDRDGVLSSSGGRASFCSIKEEADRYVAALIIGIDRNAKASRNPGGRRPPGQPPAGSPPAGDPGPGSFEGGRRGAFVPGTTG